MNAERCLQPLIDTLQEQLRNGGSTNARRISQGADRSSTALTERSSTSGAYKPTRRHARVALAASLAKCFVLRWVNACVVQHVLARALQRS